VVHGARDRLVPLAAGEYLSRNLPAARLEVMRGAAHAPFVSRARETAQVLEVFFDER
jgi:pimeloyl-[acyl-carrier protein] methyl ester esterase